MTKRSFSELSRRTQTIIVSTGVLELALLIAAQADLTRRPAHQVRGSKLGWRLLTFINVVGPIAYFRWGRRPAGSE